MFSKYDLHEAMGYRLGELPFDRKITPTEMRVGLARASYYSTVIRNVRTMAELEGWNGEDTITAIAFYTTLQLEVARQNLHDVSAKRANPPFFIPESTYRAENGACDPSFTGEKAAEDIFKGGPHNMAKQYKK